MTEDLGRVGRDNLLSLVRTLRAELEQARHRARQQRSTWPGGRWSRRCLTCRGGREYKAMWRNGLKPTTDALEDLKKAKWYLDAGSRG